MIHASQDNKNKKGSEHMNDIKKIKALYPIGQPVMI